MSRLRVPIVAFVFSIAVITVSNMVSDRAHALPRGLAATPPMGWNSWNAFGCDIHEQLIRETVDALVASGMAAAGYEYINLDDCWMAYERNSDGNLQPDPSRFPSGIAGIADYIHARGLKLGIYSSAGTLTCAGRPGSLGLRNSRCGPLRRMGRRLPQIRQLRRPSRSHRDSAPHSDARCPAGHRQANHVQHLQLGSGAGSHVGRQGRPSQAHHTRHPGQLGPSHVDTGSTGRP
jgi:hypothetical protein